MVEGLNGLFPPPSPPPPLPVPSPSPARRTAASLEDSSGSKRRKKIVCGNESPVFSTYSCLPLNRALGVDVMRSMRLTD